MKVDDEGASGDGKLVELTFKTTDAPSASDFQVSDSVLIGVDGAVDLLKHVEIGDLDPLPDRFELKQNVPNPFNPSTAIGYQLAEAGFVRLAVYSVLGQEVRVLVNQRQQAGSFTATWDGTDALGRRVASGIYLYRLDAGNFTAVRRILLVKWVGRIFANAAEIVKVKLCVSPSKGRSSGCGKRGPLQYPDGSET